MGGRSSFHEVFERVKTRMGLERFEVRLFFRENCAKFDLALNGVTEILLKLPQKVFMLC